jgi:hypothetical protein
MEEEHKQKLSIARRKYIELQNTIQNNISINGELSIMDKSGT